MANLTESKTVAALNLMTPADNVFLITPSNTVDLAIPARGISFAVAGALEIIDAAGNTVIIPSGALAAGVMHPIRATRVRAAGTTATGIVGYA